MPWNSRPTHTSPITSRARPIASWVTPPRPTVTRPWPAPVESPELDELPGPVSTTQRHGVSQEIAPRRPHPGADPGFSVDSAGPDVAARAQPRGGRLARPPGAPRRGRGRGRGFPQG